MILKCAEGGEVIHCRGLASPQGLIDLIDQKEDQEEEGGPKRFLARSRTKVVP